MAIANPNAAPATISIYFTDESGLNFGGRTITLAPSAQISAFLDQPPFFTANPFSSPIANARTLTFTSDVPVSALALRGTVNERSEFLIAPLPVADLSETSADPLSIPNMADGGGWTTQVVLVNLADDILTGTMQFFTGAGQAMTVTIAGQAANQFAYSLPPRSSRRFDTAGTADTTQTGSIRIVPATGARSPLGSALISLRSAGVPTTEMTVPGTRPSTAFRTYAEAAGGFTTSQPGSIQAGVAVANHGSAAATVTVELFGLDGVSSGLTGTLTIPSMGQTAVFLNRIPGFGSLPASYQGVVRISTTASGIAATGFRARYNERVSLLISSVPAINENNPAAGDLVFPHLVDSAGYSTQLVMMNGSAGQSYAGVLRFYSQAGQSLTMTLR